MNHKITAKQIEATLFMFWMGSIVVIGASSQAKQDSWIAILLAGILFLPLMFLYIRLSTLYPGKNLYEILFAVFGKIFGRVITLIYVLYSIHLGALVLNVFSTFIHVLNMPETPEPAILFFIILLAVWTVKSGPENIGRISKYTFPILVASILVTFVLSIKDMDLGYLKPIMNTDMKTLLSSALSVCILPLGEIIICLSFLSAVDNQVKMSKVYFQGMIWTLAIILIVNIRNILILGFPSVTMFYFPSYEAVSIISIGEFFSRIEVLIGVNLMLAGFIKVAVCVYSASLGLTKLLNAEDQKLFVVPCGLMMVTLSGMLYENTIEWMESIKIYEIYAIPFLVLLPVVILIGAEIRARKNRTKTKNPPAPNKEAEGS
ncbi:GerAB/ArcD/ProY family transporter [Caproiciproducens faecalis]|uniref:Endospore germination permease n=1 Tax=Caproiciproducens faecalis TaxID=2820301 RepID=A0ABS7DJX1_9FIRM|nr:endospore germination permease [Caproiciproducens faecalis]MBW7571401.1 endospore germination permease [Caproiciproducens faecalis]